MKIKQLIKLLEELDQELEVKIPNDEWNFLYDPKPQVTYARLEKDNYTKGNELRETLPEAKGAFKVVIL